MKSNPLLEKIAQAKQPDTEKVLSDFYDHIAKYYDLVDMKPGKEFLIKSFIEN